MPGPHPWSQTPLETRGLPAEVGEATATLDDNEVAENTSKHEK